jgi:hypothetical protein
MAHLLSPCGKMCSFVLSLLLTSVISSPAICDFAHAPVLAGDSHAYHISVLIGGRQVGSSQSFILFICCLASF